MDRSRRGKGRERAEAAGDRAAPVAGGSFAAAQGIRSRNREGERENVERAAVTAPKENDVRLLSPIYPGDWNLGLDSSSENPCALTFLAPLLCVCIN